MLQNLRDTLHTHRWLAIILFGGLALMFAAWGAFGVVNISFSSGNYGLKVNGEEIPKEALARAWQSRLANYERATKSELPEAERLVLQERLLDEYVRETVLRQRAQSAGYRVGNAALAAAYQNESAFQVNGKFDQNLAKAMLAQNGLTPAAFEADERRQLQIEQLTRGLELSYFHTPGELKQIYALENEQREIRFAVLPQARFAAAIKPDEASVQAWYNAHPTDYQTPESLQLQYAELRLDALAAQVTVTPEALSAYYEKNRARYVVEERRHASHILISLAAGADAAADGAALNKAREVLAQVRAGKDFAALAKQYSGDSGSAAKGGDLGWSDPGSYVKPFAEALRALKQGQVSEPVKTQFGYHIIRLDELQPARVKTLEDSRAEIEAALRKEQASELFGDKQEQLQQRIESGQGDLQALAREFSLTVGEVPAFTRSGAAPLGAKPELVSEAFRSEVADQGRLGGPVALADDRLVVLHALAHRRAAPIPLASVHAEIIEAIRKDQGAKAAKAAADAALLKLNANAPWEATVKELGVSTAPAAFVGRGDPQLPVQIRDGAFAAAHPLAGKPQYRAIGLDNGDAGLIAVLSVKPGVAGANASADQQLVQQYMRRDRALDLNAYIQDLVRQATVKRNASALQ